MDANLETCRCGVELIVRHGAVTHCTHCDGMCAGGRDCGFCHQLRCTCTDCGTGHVDARAGVKCELSHPINGAV